MLHHTQIHTHKQTHVHQPRSQANEEQKNRANWGGENELEKKEAKTTTTAKKENTRERESELDPKPSPAEHSPPQAYRKDVRARVDREVPKVVTRVYVLKPSPKDMYGIYQDSKSSRPEALRKCIYVSEMKKLVSLPRLLPAPVCLFCS